MTAEIHSEFKARCLAMAEQMRQLRPGDKVRVTTHGSKRSITRKGEVEFVRDFGGSLVYIVCWQKRYEGQPYESHNRFSAFASSTDAIEKES